MKIKYVFWVLFLSLLFTLFINNIVSAGYVPWTIVQSSWVSPEQTCANSENNYKTWYSCSTASCLLNKLWVNSACGCDIYDQVNTTCKILWPSICTEYNQELMEKCTNKWYVQWIPLWESCNDFFITWNNVWTELRNTSCKTTSSSCLEWNTENGTVCNTYKSCRTGANGCQTLSKTTPIFTSSTYYDKNKDTKTYNLKDLITVPSDHAILWTDSNIKCITTAEWTNHTPAKNIQLSTCDILNSSYYSTAGSNGVCNKFQSLNNYLDSNTVNQIWAWIFRRNIRESKNTCTAEWRYAKIDSAWPTITASYGSLQTDTIKWCNLNKYKAIAPFSWTYGSNTNINTPGCEHYNKTDWLDLVDNFSINVKDVSGLSKVQVELWTCSAYYDFTWLALTDLLSSVNTSNWIDPAYSELTINAYTSSVYGMSWIVSLKTLFWKTRLDDCLWEWENYLKITAYDAARSLIDAISLDANKSELFNKTYAIRIDNSGPTFRPVSTYKYDNDYKEQATSVFDSSFDADTWYNSTIDWSFIMNDGVNPNEVLCTQYIQNWTGTCPTVAGKVWKSPVLADGTYAKYECDGIAITDDSVCKFDCDSGYVLSVDSSTCEAMPVIYDWYNIWYVWGCILWSEYKLVSCSDITDSSNTTNISACNMVNLKSSLATWESIYNHCLFKKFVPTHLLSERVN